MGITPRTSDPASLLQSPHAVAFLFYLSCLCIFAYLSPTLHVDSAPCLKKSRQGDQYATRSVSDNAVRKPPAVPEHAAAVSVSSSSLSVQSMKSHLESHLDSSSAALVGPPAASRAAAKTSYDPAANSNKGGPRIRLPDKLMEYLNSQVVAPDILWWQNEEGFAFDSTRIQTEFLDKHFEKTKLKSFIRSLNRW